MCIFPILTLRLTFHSCVFFSCFFHPSGIQPGPLRVYEFHSRDGILLAALGQWYLARSYGTLRIRGPIVRRKSVKQLQWQLWVLSQRLWRPRLALFRAHQGDLEQHQWDWRIRCVQSRQWGDSVDDLWDWSGFALRNGPPEKHPPHGHWPSRAGRNHAPPTFPVRPRHFVILVEFRRKPERAPPPPKQRFDQQN